MNKELFNFVVSHAPAIKELGELKATGKTNDNLYTPDRIAGMLTKNEHLILLSSIIKAINKSKIGNIIVNYRHLLAAMSMNGISLNTATYVCKNETYFKPCNGFRECLITLSKALETLSLLGFNLEETKCIMKKVRYFSISNYKSYLTERVKAITNKQLADSEFIDSITINPKYYSFNKEFVSDSLKKTISGYANEHIANPTESEKMMMQILDNNGIKYEFQRTCRVSGNIYIMDFFLPENNICIEIDGGYHFTQEQLLKDRKRDADMARVGILVIRITNKEVNILRTPYLSPYGLGPILEVLRKQ